MLRVGIAGGSGYGGAELVHILLQHPEVQITFLSSEQYAGESAITLFPHLRGFLDLEFTPLETISDCSLDVLFLALPHGKAMQIVPSLDPQLLVVDLSGDFRISDPLVFESYYGFPMIASEYQASFIYGLPEVNRPQLQTARYVANPGCFATATILALYPLCREGVIDGRIFVDSKTGSSGSGRTPSAKTHHPRRSQSLFAYKPFRHQHIPEMEQLLGPESPLVFQPHSAPFVRGIFASHYCQLKDSLQEETLVSIYQDYYKKEPFVRLTSGCPDLSAIQHSNFVDVGFACQDQTLIVWSTLDNLQKGAAGQAVQNMNIACGLPETMALNTPPAFP